MYKRYLEPNDDTPLTRYMTNKKIQKLNTNPRVLNSEIVSPRADINVIQDTDSEDVIVGEEIENVEMTQTRSKNIERESNDIPPTSNIDTSDLTQNQSECIQLEIEDVPQASNPDDDYFNIISEQLIHPNLDCKTADVIAMILAYFLQHHLTWVALEDLLTLLHNIVGDESNLPKTKYLFKKCFGPGQRSVFHFYCGKCMVYIDTYEKLKAIQDEKDKKGDKKCETCTVCGNDYSLKKMNKGHFFIELPLREQIEKRLSENADILTYNTKSNSADITDFFDGELYKSLRVKVGSGPLVTLTLNTDGVKVFKSKKKGSLWPIQMFINEVPPNKRLKTDNIILTGIWFGNDICFELYLKPLTEELKNLDEKKICANVNNVNKLVTIRVLFISADLPAKGKLLKLKQYNGKFGCNRCLHPGVTVEDNNSSKYPVSTEKYSLRTHSSTMALMNAYLLTGKEHFGVIGVSPLIAFKDYDLIRGTVIDYMHCILEGVQNLLLDLWFDSKRHHENYYINPRGAEVVNKNLKAITPFRSFSIKPRTIDEREYWKAHELKYWLLFYAAPCLTGTMKSIYFKHFTLLSEATFIFLKSKIIPSDYEKASKNLFKFTKEFQDHYGVENMMAVVHLLEHMPKCVKDCGPMWCYSNFNFESNNGSLVKHVNGTTDVEHQIASKYSLNNRLAGLKKKMETTFDYIDRMKSMRVKTSRKIGQITIFGSPHKHKLDAKQKQNLLTSCDHMIAYYKFFYGNDVYYSITYERAEQTNDTVVLLKNGQIGQIMLIFIDKECVNILLKILSVEAVDQFPSHIKKVCKNVIEEFLVVPAEDILLTLLLISTVKENYLSELPNQFEGD